MEMEILLKILVFGSKLIYSISGLTMRLKFSLTMEKIGGLLCVKHYIVHEKSL